MQNKPTIFSKQLRTFCDQLGTTNAAELCGVTARCLRLWMAPGAKEPCRAMKVGVVAILRSERINQILATKPQKTKETK